MENIFYFFWEKLIPNLDPTSKKLVEKRQV